TVVIDGKTISLDAEAGTFLLRNQDNEVIALFGYTFYNKKGIKNNMHRPIVFAFNGGPLAASVPLHIGALGPKRVIINDPDYTASAPYQITNNKYSILDVADLVMIDPIGTGLSKIAGKSEFKDFWGVDQDIKSIGNFIEQFLIHKEKMNAPKYLLGESYGTFRNAGLVKFLQDKGIAMNGVIMVSAVFELSHLMFPYGDDFSYLSYFPSYAATAWYHDKISDKKPDLEEFMQEVRSFTENEYAPALFKGDKLSKEEKGAMSQKLSKYSGLSKKYWQNADLRVHVREFFVELHRADGKSIGRLDSRYTGINQDLLAQRSTYDPMMKALVPPYIAAFKDYFYNDLKVSKNLSYLLFAGSRKGFKWDWRHKENITWNAQTSISTAGDLATAMSQNPNLKILILNGYFDLATPFYAVEHSINHMGLQAEIKKNIIMKYYKAGHMMYTHEPSLKKFKADIKGFILSTSK
ncbi:MAG: carboxypeptidase, partial [Bacteroidetes bacterium]